MLMIIHYDTIYTAGSKSIWILTDKSDEKSRFTRR